MNETNIILVINTKNYLGLNFQIQKNFSDEVSPEEDHTVKKNVE